MATTTPRLNLPRPEPSDNVNLANHQELIDAIDSAAETPAGAQAKANAAQQAAKTYTDTEVGKRATKTEFNAHTGDNLAHNATPSPFANRIMSRDANGRAAIADPTVDSHVANKKYVDDSVSSATVNVAKTNVDNNFTTRQTVKNGETYQYIGVRRDVNDTEYGAEVAVSAGGNAQLTKREDGNIVASISLYNANDARVGSNRIWTEGNLPNPAQTDINNNFSATQTIRHGGLSMLQLERTGSINPAEFLIHTGYGRFNIVSGTNTSDTRFTIAPNGNVGIGTPYTTADPAEPLHVGGNARIDGNLTVGGENVALQNGSYANLRARATTKADVGLGNVTNDAQLKIASNLSDVANVSTARSNLGLTGNSNTTHYHDSRYYTKSQVDSELNSVKQSVGNGKTAIRDAIIDAGGTAPTGSPDSYTHQDLANAISTVSKYASGSTPAQATVQIRGINFDVGAFSFFYQTSDDGGVSVMFTNPYSPFVRKTSTTAADPVITPVSGGFNITLDRPAGTNLTWEAWGS